MTLYFYGATGTSAGTLNYNGINGALTLNAISADGLNMNGVLLETNTQSTFCLQSDNNNYLLLQWVSQGSVGSVFTVFTTLLSAVGNISTVGQPVIFSIGVIPSAGSTGPTGPTGPKGTQGTQGNQGNPGTPGTNGATGPTGSAGSAGSVGPTGASGSGTGLTYGQATFSNAGSGGTYLVTATVGGTNVSSTFSAILTNNTANFSLTSSSALVITYSGSSGNPAIIRAGGVFTALSAGINVYVSINGVQNSTPYFIQAASTTFNISWHVGNLANSSQVGLLLYSTASTVAVNFVSGFLSIDKF